MGDHALIEFLEIDLIRWSFFGQLTLMGLKMDLDYRARFIDWVLQEDRFQRLTDLESCAALVEEFDYDDKWRI